MALIKNCTNCGNPVSKTSHGRRTCSDECANARTLIGRKIGQKIGGIPPKPPTGKDHPLWLGGKERRKQKLKEYAEKFPERVRARQRVRDAIRRGRLTRKPCEVCGSFKSEAHHEDYSNPLSVNWLCRMHHREADRRIGLGSKDFKHKA